MENHNIEPIYNEHSKILILGSFPSVKSRESRFFYNHPQNRFWKVLATILKYPVPISIEDKKIMLLDNNIALWDTIKSCEIVGSSDSSIKNVIPNDISKIITESQITKIYTNGNTAHKMYMKYIFKDVELSEKVLPSTSPANARFSLDRLVEHWSIIITDI